MNQTLFKTKRTWLYAGIFLFAIVISLTYFFVSRTWNAGSATYETAQVTRGTLSAEVGATGLVRARQSVNLVWNTAGRVETVKVNIGDQISANKLLASLSFDSVPQSILLAKSDLIVAQQDLDNLVKSNIATAQAMKALADASQVVKDAQDAYNTLTRKRVSDQLIQDTSDALDKANDQLHFMEYIFRRFFSHRIEGASNKARMVLQLASLKDNVANLTAKYNWYTSKASDLQIQKSLAELKLAQAKEEDAQRALERVKNGNNVDDIKAAKARVAAAQATVNLAQISSPFSGTITKISVLSGDRVSSGQSAFRIDDLTHLMVDLQISEVDINSVEIGQPVTITLEAIPNKIYNGVVSSVNQAAKSGQGGINFKVSITLTDPDVSKDVKPGMTASVTITVKEISSTLLVPNRAVRLVNGQRIIYILKVNQPIPITIRLGSTANDFSQVVGGDLKEGDMIILNPPNLAASSVN